MFVSRRRKSEKWTLLAYLPTCTSNEYANYWAAFSVAIRRSNEENKRWFGEKNIRRSESQTTKWNNLAQYWVQRTCAILSTNWVKTGLRLGRQNFHAQRLSLFLLIALRGLILIFFFAPISCDYTGFWLQNSIRMCFTKLQSIEYLPEVADPDSVEPKLTGMHTSLSSKVKIQWAAGWNFHNQNHHPLLEVLHLIFIFLFCCLTDRWKIRYIYKFITRFHDLSFPSLSLRFSSVSSPFTTHDCTH